MLGSRWERPLALGLAVLLGFPMLLFGGLAGVAACLVVMAACIGLYLVLLHLVGRSYLSVAPQVEVVLGRLGTPSGP